MSTVTVMTRGTAWTVDELEDLPDDGRQYELFDGALVASAAPRIPHQRAVGACFALLRTHCPPELETFVSPVDFQPTPHTSLQPDVLVARRDALGVKNLTVAPVLVVEVLSRGTRAKDLVFKRALYQRGGVQSYWVIDPDRVSLTAYDLVEGAYRSQVEVRGSETLTVYVPFTVAVCPADLVSGR